ncbi:MAG: shikimate kinase [Clostridia bacterium]|nr:shikimate kinase [Clostridia bacterium]
MPGSGKTTVGKKLAELLHKDFYDTDEMIEYREGKSPEDIINEMGEPAFREKERETCMVLSQVKNAVIATGGGIVLQDDNFYSLTNNGTVVLLKRDLEKLDRTGRPLSTDLLKLYTKRAPLYDTWKDIEVDGEGKTIDEIAKEITERLEI